MRLWFTAALLCLSSAHALAANEVRVFLGGGNLFVYGDAQDNSIAIFSSAPGTIEVAGFSNSQGQPTVVNGQSNGVVVLQGWQGGIFAYLYNGNDDLTLYDVTVMGAVELDLGRGNDGLHVGQTSSAIASNLLFGTSSAKVAGPVDAQSTLLVNAGPGNDLVEICGTLVGGRASLDLGDGMDILVAGCPEVEEGFDAPADFLDTLTVKTGREPDQATLTDVFVAKNLVLDDANGSLDLDVINGSVGQDLIVNGSPSADDVQICNVDVTGQIQVTTGNGNDSVFLSGQSSEGRVDTGSGNDSLTIDNYTTGTLRTLLGAGSDSLTTSESDFAMVFGYGGTGNDQFMFGMTMVDQISLFGDGGTDSLTQAGSTFGSLRTFSIEKK